MGCVRHGGSWFWLWWFGLGGLGLMVMGLVSFGLIAVLGYVGDVSLRYRLIVFG